ncbi:MAG: hypothetical protein HQL11_03860, partial [Candidatus Omnitrophica bacterium]|nr:hypothetical protein [Candidatus Omnitrophota bacterium]
MSLRGFLLTRRDRIGEALWVAALLAVGAWLLFGGLSGAIIHQSDETKAVLNYFPASPGLFCLARPWVVRFGTFDAVYYLNAALALGNVAWVYLWVRASFRTRVAVLTGWAYLLMDLPLAHARVLNYSTAVCFFVFGSAVCFMAGQKSRNLLLYCASGASGAMALLMHPAAFVPLLALGTWIAWTLWGMKASRQGLTRGILGTVCMAGSFLGVAALVDFFYYRKMNAVFLASHHYEGSASYFAHAWYHAQHSIAGPFADLIGIAGLKRLLWNIIGGTPPEPAVLLVHAIAIGAVIYGLLLAVRTRNHPAFGMYMFAAAFGVPVALSLLGWQNITPRHFTAISAVLAFSVGYTLDHSLGRGPQIRTLGVLLALVFLVLSAVRAAEIRTSVPSWNTVESFMAERGIPKTQILTNFTNFNRLEDFRQKNIARPVPIIWENGLKRIDWQNVFAAYLAGRARYLLAPGLDPEDWRAESTDPLLEATAPLATWPHPLSNRRVVQPDEV